MKKVSALCVSLMLGAAPAAYAEDFAGLDLSNLLDDLSFDSADGEGITLESLLALDLLGETVFSSDSAPLIDATILDDDLGNGGDIIDLQIGQNDSDLDLGTPSSNGIDLSNLLNGESDGLLGDDFLEDILGDDGAVSDLLDNTDSSSDDGLLGDNGAVSDLLDDLTGSSDDGDSDNVLDDLLGDDGSVSDLLDDLTGSSDDGDSGDVLDDLLGDDGSVSDLLDDLTGSSDDGDSGDILDDLLGDDGSVSDLLDDLTGSSDDSGNSNGSDGLLGGLFN